MRRPYGEVRRIIEDRLKSGPATCGQLAALVGDNSGQMARTMAWMIEMGYAKSNAKGRGSRALYTLP